MESEIWIAASQSSNPGERMMAAFMLGIDRQDANVPLLRKLLRDEHPDVRDFAGASLGALSDLESVDDLLSLLDRTPPSRAMETAWAVAQLAFKVDGSIRDRIHASLERYRRRSRGFSRRHAIELLAAMAK